MFRLAVCFVLSLGLGCAQTPPRFDVASIRPSSPEQLEAGWSGIQSAHGTVSVLNAPLRDIIADAYGVAEDRILGGPAWIYSDRFQITAKAEPSVGKEPAGKEILDAMLRTLLAERFNLKLHHETRVRETLALEVAKHGPKLQSTALAYPSYKNGPGRLDVTNLTMTQFAEIVSHELRVPVVDRTRLTGAYRFTLIWNSGPAGTTDPFDAAAHRRFELSTAMTEQLGLTLKPKRIPAEMFVIDHAEKPSEN